MVRLGFLVLPIISQGQKPVQMWLLVLLLLSWCSQPVVPVPQYTRESWLKGQSIDKVTVGVGRDQDSTRGILSFIQRSSIHWMNRWDVEMNRGQCPEIKAWPESLGESSLSTDVGVSVQLSDEDWNLNRETGKPQVSVPFKWDHWHLAEYSRMVPSTLCPDSISSFCYEWTRIGRGGNIIWDAILILYNTVNSMIT